MKVLRNKATLKKLSKDDDCYVGQAQYFIITLGDYYFN